MPQHWTFTSLGITKYWKLQNHSSSTRTLKWARREGKGKDRKSQAASQTRGERQWQGWICDDGRDSRQPPVCEYMQETLSRPPRNNMLSLTGWSLTSPQWVFIHVSGNWYGFPSGIFSWTINSRTHTWSLHWPAPPHSVVASGYSVLLPGGSVLKKKKKSVPTNKVKTALLWWQPQKSYCLTSATFCSLLMRH